MAENAQTGNPPVSEPSDIDPEAMAREELASAMVPTPGDIAEMLSPIACLLFLEQMGWATLTCWTAWLSDIPEGTEAPPDNITAAFMGLAEAIGTLDAVAVLVALIPPEQAVTP